MRGELADMIQGGKCHKAKGSRVKTLRVGT